MAFHNDTLSDSGSSWLPVFGAFVTIDDGFLSLCGIRLMLTLFSLSPVSYSVGSVVGQIAGSIYGLPQIPQEWIACVQKWDNNGDIALRAYMLVQRVFAPRGPAAKKEQERKEREEKGKREKEEKERAVREEKRKEWEHAEERQRA